MFGATGSTSIAVIGRWLAAGNSSVLATVGIALMFVGLGFKVAAAPFHVWTQDYATKRLRWKRTHPLHVLLLRVYRIPRPVTVRVKDEYHGCLSWVEIDRDLPFEGTPVMADEEFDRAAATIREICEAEAVPA